MVYLQIEGKPIPFIFDTGAKFSVVIDSVAPPGNQAKIVVEVTSKEIKLPVLQSRKCVLKGHEVQHKFY